MIIRHIRQILYSHGASEGGGVALCRVQGRQPDDLDPFLVLEEMRPDDSDGESGGFPPHPHRGLAMLTYLLAGSFLHEDNQGHHAVLQPGGAQWLSAGQGVIHAMRTGKDASLLHGFEVWVNLPARRKMQTPECRQVTADSLPHVPLAGGGMARVVAGSWQLADETMTSPLDNLAANARLLDLHLPADACLALTVPANDTLLAYVYDGSLAGSTVVQRGQMARYSDGDTVQLVAGSAGVRLLLLAGTPLAEPLARYGPFAMSNEEEILQALSDYRNGRFGKWQSGSA